MAAINPEPAPMPKKALNFRGDIQNSLPHGQGMFIYENGDSFEGEWKQGRKDGEGCYKWAFGSVFYGKYLLDKRQGSGMHVWIDGSKFLGTWQNDERHGMGISRDQLGAEFVEEWQRGARVSCVLRSSLKASKQHSLKIVWETNLKSVQKAFKDFVPKQPVAPAAAPFTPTRATQDVQALVQSEQEKKGEETPAS